MLHGLILVVGPDGAGKTTVLDEFERQLGQPLQRAHSRPGTIAGRSSDGSPVTDPHGQRPRGVVLSLAKLLVVLADTVIGTWRRWKPLARDGLLVVERGWYDLAVDPHRYRLPTSFAPLVAALGRFVPRADVVVLLTGDPAELHRRKPEIGVAEVTRQLAAWEQLAGRAGRQVVRIDTVAQPPTESAAALLAALARPAGRWRRVPAAPARLALRATGPGPALAIYRPHRRPARVATRVNAPALRLGLAPRTDAPPIPRLARLATRGPRPATQLAAFRSSGPDRWIVGIADQHGLHTVLKAGPHDDTGLDTEVAALEALRPTATLALPTLAWEEVVDGWRVVAMPALAVTEPVTDLDRVAELTTQLVRGDLGQPVVHGDLAPWNLGVGGGANVVWDWEEAELDAVRPLHDLTHYVIRSGTLLGSCTPHEAARLLTGPSGPGAHHLQGLGVDPVDAPSYVRAYLDRTAPATVEERTFRRALAAALPPTK